MTDAWGYVRLSGESGDSPDAGIDEQKRSIREYADRNDLSLQTTRNDGTRTSGFSTDRHEYQLLRSKVETGDIGAVVTRDRARLSRDFDERLWLITAMRSAGVEWHVTEVGDRLHLDDVQNAGFECVHAMMDHIKKMTEIKRSKKATQARKERGCYQGYPPLGLTFADDGCHLERTDRWPVVERAIGALDAGHGVASVARQTDLTYNQVYRIDQKGTDYHAELLAEYGISEE